MRKRAGFTLVELMIVVAIIAILAAVAIPLYMHIVQQSKHRATAHIQAIWAFEEQYFKAQGRYLACPPWPEDFSPPWEEEGEEVPFQYHVLILAGGQACVISAKGFDTSGKRIYFLAASWAAKQGSSRVGGVVEVK